MWTIGVLQREQVLGIDVLMEVMEVVVEETLVPTIGEDPIPKGNVVSYTLRDKDDRPVEAPELAGDESLAVDEMG